MSDIAWFKVDDQMYDHPKFARLSLGAIGLWSTAGSYCARHLTDGFLPDPATPLLRPGADEHRAELVSVGLWEEVIGGVRFHDWSEYQPSRESVLAERQASKDRQRRAREAARARRESEGSHAVTNAVTSPEVTAKSPRESRPPQPDPARPVVPTELPTTTAPRKRGTRIDDGFAVNDEMRAWAVENVPLVADDLDAATAEFVDYWRAIAGSRGTKLDWVATWRNRMRQVQERRERVRPIRDTPSTGEAAIWRQARGEA